METGHTNDFAEQRSQRSVCRNQFAFFGISAVEPLGPLAHNKVLQGVAKRVASEFTIQYSLVHELWNGFSGLPRKNKLLTHQKNSQNVRRRFFEGLFFRWSALWGVRGHSGGVSLSTEDALTLLVGSRPTLEFFSDF